MPNSDEFITHIYKHIPGTSFKFILCRHHKEAVIYWKSSFLVHCQYPGPCLMALVVPLTVRLMMCMIGPWENCRGLIGKQVQTAFHIVIWSARFWKYITIVNSMGFPAAVVWVCGMIHKVSTEEKCTLR